MLRKSYLQIGGLQQHSFVLQNVPSTGRALGMCSLGFLWSAVQRLSSDKILVSTQWGMQQVDTGQGSTMQLYALGKILHRGIALERDPRSMPNRQSYWRLSLHSNSPASIPRWLTTTRRLAHTISESLSFLPVVSLRSSKSTCRP